MTLFLMGLVLVVLVVALPLLGLVVVAKQAEHQEAAVALAVEQWAKEEREHLELLLRNQALHSRLPTFER